MININNDMYYCTLWFLNFTMFKDENDWLKTFKFMLFSHKLSLEFVPKCNCDNVHHVTKTDLNYEDMKGKRNLIITTQYHKHMMHTLNQLKKL
jgi:hypothetical protein